MTAWTIRRACAVLCATLFFGGPSPAQTALACPSHIVKRGDTLGIIAERFLGDKERAQEVYVANRAVVGRNPDIITLGMVLQIPCDTGARIGVSDTPARPSRGKPAASGGADAVAQRLRAAAAKAAPQMQSFHLIGGGPFSPYVSRDDPGRGLAMALVQAAFDTLPDTTTTLGIVADRAAHLEVILPRGGLHLSFPWVYPECGETSQLTPTEARLCADYIASDSLYEQVTEFFARADGAWAQVETPTAMMGARLCRPVGYPTGDLTRLGLLPDGVRLVRAKTPLDCLRAVDGGRVDIASMDARLTRALVTTKGLQNPLIVLEAFTSVDPLRAIARREDPQGRAAIAAFNTGLATLAETGQWFEIVEQHLNVDDTGG